MIGPNRVRLPPAAAALIATMLGDERSERMADDMRPLDAQVRAIGERIDQHLDRDLRAGVGERPGARQVGPDQAKAGQRRHQRLEGVRGAAETVDQDDRRALALGFDRHPDRCTVGHARHSTNRFSSVPMPSISTRTTSPLFRYFGGSKPMPTPAGVPVAMMSPGISVMPAEMRRDDRRNVEDQEAGVAIAGGVRR